MTTYEFTLILSGITEVTDEAADALFDAGCDDGSFVSRDGVAFVIFHREDRTLRDAIDSAIADVKKAGFGILRVETDDANVVAKINANLLGSVAR